MTGFHTWYCRCEGVDRDSGCGHKESHLMHDTEHSIYDCIIYMKYEWMFTYCHCICTLCGE